MFQKWNAERPTHAWGSFGNLLHVGRAVYGTLRRSQPIAGPLGLALSQRRHIVLTRLSKKRRLTQFLPRVPAPAVDLPSAGLTDGMGRPPSRRLLVLPDAARDDGTIFQAMPWTLTRKSSRRLSPAGFIQPALPTLVDSPPRGAQWIHEIKHDGYRLIACKEHDAVRLSSRYGTDFTDSMKSIAASVASLPAESAVVDGEAVVLRGDGHSNFGALRTRAGARATYRSRPSSPPTGRTASAVGASGRRC